MAESTAIVWFRRNLRLADNPALATALKRHALVVPVYVHAPDEEAEWAPGAASRAWLARSLAALDASLRDRGSRLVVLSGPSAEALARLAAATGARAVYHDRRVEPAILARDARARASLSAHGIALTAIDCALLHEPPGPRSASGGPYRVFTAFHNAVRALGPARMPLPAPGRVPPPDGLPRGLDPASVAAGAAAMPGLDAHWTPGEDGAHARAERFFAEAAAAYAEGRDRPDLDLTSRLSPHLSFGEIGPAQLVRAAEPLLAAGGDAATGATAFVRQLHWREFAYHLLHHAPATPSQPLRPEFEAFPWAHDDEGFAAWAKGRTGYPLVDAGMRQLAASGWMHNRVRMVAASFLTKDLLLPWTEGARFFWEHLADADLANNTFGWQWVAGSGADAAPYFRIFNPALQGDRFDPDGTYVKRWLPEFERLPARWVHRPWSAPQGVLAEAGVVLGETYPRPIIDHAEARSRALAMYASVRGRKE